MSSSLHKNKSAVALQKPRKYVVLHVTGFQMKKK